MHKHYTYFHVVQETGIFSPLIFQIVAYRLFLFVRTETNDHLPEAVFKACDNSLAIPVTSAMTNHLGQYA